MKRKLIYIILISFLSVTCDRIEESDGIRRISLKAGIGDTEISAKSASADPYEGTSPTAGNPLVADVWFSKSDTEFLHNPTEDEATNLPCHTTMTFTSAAATYADYTDAQSFVRSLRYPTTETPVYCVGFYPSADSGDDWKTTDGKIVTHPINGSEDLMFADVISGTWNNHFQSQQYRHILTWVKISVCAMTMETARQWGKVTRITVSSKNTVSIDLSKASGASGKVIYGGGDQHIVVYDDASGMDLNLTSQEAGSVFCSPMTVSIPVTGTGDTREAVGYEVKITTENGGEKTIPIQLTDLEYSEINDIEKTAGKLFILSLYFNPFNIIEGTCTLNYWSGQNEDLYLTQTTSQS